MSITCREFERQWNELLDAWRRGPTCGSRSDRAATIRARLMAHAAGCVTCREKAAKYEALRSAILAVGPAARAGRAGGPNSDRARGPATTSAWPVHATDRRPARWTRGRRDGIGRRVARGLVLIVIVLGPSEAQRARRSCCIRDRSKSTVIGGSNRRPHPARLPRAQHGVGRCDRGDAGSRSGGIRASGADRPPGHRCGSQARAGLRPYGTGRRRADSIAMVVSVPSLDALAPDPAAAAAMWHQVGDGLADGVRPLTSTARHAFGFLLGPAQVKPELRNNPPADKGA